MMLRVITNVQEGHLSIPNHTDKEFKAAERLIMAVAGQKPVSNEEEQACITLLDDLIKGRYLTMKLGVTLKDYDVEHAHQEGSLLEIMLAYAHQGRHIIEHLIEKLGSHDPRVETFWLNRGYKEPTQLSNHMRLEKMKEPPSDIVLDIIFQQSDLDLSRVDKSGLSTIDKIAGALIRTVRTRVFDTNNLHHRRLKRALSLHPHFHTPEIADSLCTEMGFYNQWNVINNKREPSDLVEGYENFYPHSIDDIQPYHMEMWATVGLLPEIINHRIWEEREHQLYDLLHSMDNQFLGDITRELVVNERIGTMPRTARPEPLKNWRAAVNAPTTSPSATLAMGGV